MASIKSVPMYLPPDWGGRPAPGEPALTLDIIKGGVELGTLDLGGDRDHFTFGRVEADIVTFVVDNPTVSRLHAAIQLKQEDGSLYLFDVNSTHGTFLNRERIDAGQFVRIYVGDSIQFGQSSRMYLVNGPDELLRPETDGDEALEELRATRAERQATLEARIERRKKAKEARARAEAAKQQGRKEGKEGEEEEEDESGISWGMGEDAVEDEEDEQQHDDEQEEGKKTPVELPDYLKNLPEHQRRLHEAKLQGEGGGSGTSSLDASEVHERDRKLYEKLRARALKIENMQTEISRIYAKEGSQGGLSDGQRAAVSRNEERIMKLREEIEGIEEQIRGKNAQREVSKADGGAGGKKGGGDSDEEDDDDDGDEFYDRTRSSGSASSRGGKGGGGRTTNWRARKQAQHHKHPAHGGAAGTQAVREVETFESLTTKAEACRKEIAELKEHLAQPLPVSGSGAEEKAKKQGGGGDEEDTLESFMAMNETKGKEDERKASERRAQELQRELARLEALIKIVRPAMPQLHPRPPPSPPKLSPASTSSSSPSMAPPPPHAPISPRTIDIHAPQPPAPPPLDLNDSGAAIPHPDADPYLPPPQPSSPSSASQAPSRPASHPTPPARPPPANKVKGPAAMPPPKVLGTAAFLPSNQPQTTTTSNSGGGKKRKAGVATADEAEEQQGGTKMSVGPTPSGGKRPREEKGEGGDEAYVQYFVKPKNQKGDGRTALNDKLGY